MDNPSIFLAVIKIRNKIKIWFQIQITLRRKKNSIERRQKKTVILAYLGQESYPPTQDSLFKKNDISWKNCRNLKNGQISPAAVFFLVLYRFRQQKRLTCRTSDLVWTRVAMYCSGSETSSMYFRTFWKLHNVRIGT